MARSIYAWGHARNSAIGRNGDISRFQIEFGEEKSLDIPFRDLKGATTSGFGLSSRFGHDFSPRERNYDDVTRRILVSVFDS